MEKLRQTLSPAEMERAGRFRFPGDRGRFTVARGTLRTLLAGYLNMRPEEIRFRYGRFGKPEIDGDRAREMLRFSVSHSGGLALYAVSLGRRVGVDIEYIQRDPMIGDIARQSFAPPENALLEACPEHLRDKAFFTLWTRKEAYLKALGTGLAKADALRGTDADAPWSFLFADLYVARGYAAALAVEGRRVALQCLQWPCSRV